MLTYLSFLLECSFSRCWFKVQLFILSVSWLVENTEDIFIKFCLLSSDSWLVNNVGPKSAVFSSFISFWGMRSKIYQWITLLHLLIYSWPSDTEATFKQKTNSSFKLLRSHSLQNNSMQVLVLQKASCSCFASSCFRTRHSLFRGDKRLISVWTCRNFGRLFFEAPFCRPDSCWVPILGRENNKSPRLPSKSSGET